MYDVYMLLCRGGVYYTGLTTDVVRRIRQHLSGTGAKFTRSHPPEALAALWHCEDRASASRVEYAIKKELSHSQKKQLIAAPDTLTTLLPQLAELTVTAADTASVQQQMEEFYKATRQP